VVLGLIFLKYISDAFEEKHSALLQQVFRPQLRKPENSANIARHSFGFGLPFGISWRRTAGFAVTSRTLSTGRITRSARPDFVWSPSSRNGILKPIKRARKCG